MHEWGLAQNLVSMIEREARAQNATRVTSIRMRIGALSGVSIDAFQFGFAASLAGTLIAPDALTIEPIDVLARCRSCEVEFSDQDGLSACPSCGGFDKEILRGTELETESFVMED